MQTVSNGKTPIDDSTVVLEHSEPRGLDPPDTGDFHPGSEAEPTGSSPKRLARIAGLLYLLVGIFGAFALAFLYPKIYVAGDAAKTAGNLVANAGLVRLGVVADLVQATILVFLALTLYLLFKGVHKSVASAMVILATIGAGINCLNAVFEFEALRVATGKLGSVAVGTVGSNALALLLVDTQHYGVFVAQIFFGLWLAPMGYLAYRSGWFPRALAILLIMACVSYLVDLLAAFLVADLGKAIHGFAGIVPAIAEIWMAGYLLVIGVKTAKPAQPAWVARAASH